MKACDAGKAFGAVIGHEPKEKSAPVSETGNKDQERQKPPRDNAATRLNELLEDIKRAGFTPAELKTFKREAQKAAEQAVEQPKPAAQEKTENPTELKPPTKPKADDFKTYEEYEAARDKYFEDVADYKAAKKFQEFQQEQARSAAQNAVKAKMDEATGADADGKEFVLRRQDGGNLAGEFGSIWNWDRGYLFSSLAGILERAKHRSGETQNSGIGMLLHWCRRGA